MGNNNSNLNTIKMLLVRYSQLSQWNNLNSHLFRKNVAI